MGDKEEKAKALVRLQRWRKKNPLKRKATRDRWRARHPDLVRKHAKDGRLRKRLRVLNHYGGLPPKCNCCGEGQIEFLVLDHIHNDGAEHRRSIQGDMFTWIINSGFPDGFQILCANCNTAKAIYGVCPHKDGQLKLPLKMVGGKKALDR